MVCAQSRRGPSWKGSRGSDTSLEPTEADPGSCQSRGLSPEGTGVQRHKDAFSPGAPALRSLAVGWQFWLPTLGQPFAEDSVSPSHCAPLALRRPVALGLGASGLRTPLEIPSWEHLTEESPAQARIPLRVGGSQAVSLGQRKAL